jgi:CheY-like chemotaxis protein
LLDLALPEMTGFELLQWKRTQPYIRRIPVVILTIDSATSAVNAAYDLGANSYLIKPGNPDEIMRIVKIIQEYWLGLNESPNWYSAPLRMQADSNAPRQRLERCGVGL